MKYLLLILLSFNLYAEDYYLTGPHELMHIQKHVKLVRSHGRNILITLKNSFPEKYNEMVMPVKLEDLKRYEPKAIKIARNTLLENILDDVDPLEVRKIVEAYTNQDDRRSGSSGNQKAVKEIEKAFKAMNLKTEVDCFRKKICNVYGVHLGSASPDEYILVEAHLDDVGHGHAGADDNASGIAGLLMIAKAVSQFKTNHSIIFFATNGEEQGLRGAKHFVSKYRSTSRMDNLKFVINMDMIGYNNNGKVDIETNKEFEPLATWYASIFTNYTSLIPNITMPAWGSDHVPFLKKGIPAILTIEHWKTKTPCYHSSCDKADSLNYDYAAQIIKANIAAVFLKDQTSLH
jgi:aminopeptidase-like protein